MPPSVCPISFAVNSSLVQSFPSSGFGFRSRGSPSRFKSFVKCSYKILRGLWSVAPSSVPAITSTERCEHGEMQTSSMSLSNCFSKPLILLKLMGSLRSIEDLSIFSGLLSGMIHVHEVSFTIEHSPSNQGLYDSLFFTSHSERMPSLKSWTASSMSCLAKTA